MAQETPDRLLFEYCTRSRDGEEIPVTVLLDAHGVHTRREGREEDVPWSEFCAAGETADSVPGNRHLGLLVKKTLRATILPCREDQFAEVVEFLSARVPFVRGGGGGATAAGSATRAVSGEALGTGTGDPELRERKQRLDERLAELPLLPASFHEALQVARNPLSSVADLERVIARNRSLASRMVKLANSPRYARARRLEKLSECLSVLGFSTARDVVLGYTLSRVLPKDVGVYGLAEYGVWRHGMAVALAARTLARRLGVPPDEEEDFLLAGLLHDVGKLLLSPFARARERELAEEVVRCEGDLPQAEQNVLGFDHQEVGARLVRRWGLSRQVQEVVLHHHLPTEAVAFRRAVALVHVANHLMVRLGIGDAARRFVKSRVDRVAFDLLGISGESLNQVEAWLSEEEVTYRMMANQLA
ncbi:MAG: HDOD domain-containing protein [Planctomycetes bacterium]|nr:HDOD domain-containing protein [Planctomycetota bacterium]